MIVVGIGIVLGLALLYAMLRWADKRDRAKGHVNRRAGEVKDAIRAGKSHKLDLQTRSRPRRPRSR